MTKEEFQALPYLLTPEQVRACGYARATLEKYAAHGILNVIRPDGVGQKRFQKRQVAQLLGWESGLDRKAWRAEKPLLAYCAVKQWTGYDGRTLKLMVAAGSLVAVRPGGIGDAKYRKETIGTWIGL